MRKGPTWFNITALALGLAFLYVPIVILVIYSFNASRLVTVWGGWSTRWYVALMHDAAMLDAAWVTLRIGLLSAASAIRIWADGLLTPRSGSRTARSSTALKGCAVTC